MTSSEQTLSFGPAQLSWMSFCGPSSILLVTVALIMLRLSGLNFSDALLVGLIPGHKTDRLDRAEDKGTVLVRRDNRITQH